MVDKSNVDFLAVVQRDTELKRVASTNGGEWAGPCPRCSGEDRFRVWPEQTRFWCRQCDWNGDAIDYVKEVHNTDFKGACDILNMPLNQPTTYRRPTANPFHQRRKASQASAGSLRPYAALDDPIWQEQAQQFVKQSVEHLHSTQGATARKYLKSRGITRDVIDRWHLGYNPFDYNAQWGNKAVYVPRGIVIPWRDKDIIWKVKARRIGEFEGAKYAMAAGGANGLYGADQVVKGTTVVMVEGEFDAITLSGVTEKVVPVATGSSSGARIQRWVTLLKFVPDKVILAFDTDEAGEKCAAWWAERLGSKAVRLCPTVHDVAGMIALGEDIDGWLATVL